jgi:hypothetical protein
MPRGLQICPTPARGQWPKLVENEAPDAKVWRRISATPRRGDERFIEKSEQH